MKKILNGLIIAYQWCIRPLLGQNCRFHPSCSEYAREAIQKHGSMNGCWLTVKRLLKCQPWHPGGHDPVP